MFERQYKLISSKEELPLRKLIRRLLEDENVEGENESALQPSVSFRSNA